VATADPPLPLAPEPVEPAPEAHALPLAKPRVVYAVMAACVVAYLATVSFGQRAEPDVLTLLCCGAKDRERIVGAGEWWRLLTAGFLHGGIVHLAVNLYGLWAIGPLVEQLWGRPAFLLLYLGSVVGSFLASLASTPGVSVGSSGAVFGLFGAVVVFSTVHHRFIREEARRGVWRRLVVVAALNVALGVALPFIDNAAHAGGFAAGLLIALVLRPLPALGLHRTSRRIANLREAGAALLPQVSSPAGGYERVSRGRGWFGTWLLRGLAALALFLSFACLGWAIQFAESADWVLLARTEMETYVVATGGVQIAAPKGWTFEQPNRRAGPYVFSRQGVGVVQLFLLTRAEAPDVAPFVRTLLAEAAKGGGTLLSQRDTEVADRPGTELVFRRTFPHSPPMRSREVVFPSSTGRIVYASLLSSDATGFRLDLLFDLMVQSIRTPGEPPRPASPWERFIANPKDPETCLELAAYYRVRGRAQGAESLLHLALAVRPGYADAHDQLAYLYATAAAPFRDPARAVHHARRALAIQPDEPVYLATLAVAYQASGDASKAMEAARRAAALAPDDARYEDLVRRLERGGGE
jgi:membrane associated rhomboid family serine protease